MPSRHPVPGPASPGDDRLADLRTLGEQLPRFLLLVHALKAHQAAEGSAALVLLFPLARLGPLRQSELAELVHADPSTVSRHVSSLIERGLVQRVADETDGRASRLVVTDAGRAQLDQLGREREAVLERVTAGWSEGDLATLTELLRRLLDDLSAGLSGVPCDPGAAPPSIDLPAPREK